LRDDRLQDFLGGSVVGGAATSRDSERKNETDDYELSGPHALPLQAEHTLHDVPPNEDGSIIQQPDRKRKAHSLPSGNGCASDSGVAEHP
jgi:hypothetical protein